jgi:hypothetical protein
MEDIRRAAKAVGLSVEEYARRVLAQQSDHTNRWRQFYHWAVNFTAEQKKTAQAFPDTTQMIREDRNNR